MISRSVAARCSVCRVSGSKLGGHSCVSQELILVIFSSTGFFSQFCPSFVQDNYQNECCPRGGRVYRLKRAKQVPLPGDCGCQVGPPGHSTSVLFTDTEEERCQPVSSKASGDCTLCLLVLLPAVQCMETTTHFEAFTRKWERSPGNELHISCPLPPTEWFANGLHGENPHTPEVFPGL